MDYSDEYLDKTHMLHFFLCVLLENLHPIPYHLMKKITYGKRL